MNSEKFRQHLIQWYKKEARVLPWRSDPTPYKVWISEMMLQQTRVDTVIAYFNRFLNEIPNVETLAEVEEERLLKLWQGLGYYSRAINLKKAANTIVQKYGGRIPDDIHELQSLPGIGPYSSGAIASIAFDRQVPAVDGNVLRIMARITASREDIGSPEFKRETEHFVKELLPIKGTGDFNQALMDLGAVICLPNGEPKCSQCPVNEFCEAFLQGLTAEIPVKKKKKARKIEKKTVFIIFSGEKFALRQRESDGLLANLWEFPNVEGHLNKEQCKEIIRSMGLQPEAVKPLKKAKHIFTHLEWDMKGFFVETAAFEKSKEYRGHDDPWRLQWATQEEINRRYSIPTAFKNFIKFCLSRDLQR